jgi:cytochrome c oxidase assembly protein subunit 15
MTRSTHNVWLHRFACVLALATLALVALGGVVTTKGVGMSVPDWPRTYGDHMFLFPPSKWMAGIFFEHSHRLWASLVGLFCGILAMWTWWHGTTGRKRWAGIGAMLLVLGLLGVRHQPGLFIAIGLLSVVAVVWAIVRAAATSDRARWLGIIALSAVIIQGVLGGLRVILDEHGWGTEFGIFHAMLAQVFFVFVCSLVLVTSNWWARNEKATLAAGVGSRLKFIFAAVTALIFVQILFGATMRHQHQGLAVPDFPLAYGKVWPATDAASVQFYNAHRMEAAGERPITAFHIAVHMLHRYTGVLAAFAIVGCAVAAWRRTTRGSVIRKAAAVWVALALFQVILGIFSILSQRKVDVTTAHVAVGALTLVVGWLSVLMVSRLTVRQDQTASVSMAQMSPGQLKHA